MVDPEDPLGGAVGIPRDVSLLSLLASHQPPAIAALWVAAGDDPLPCTVIGVAGDGVVEIDLDRDGPHALMAGTTGAGKSELLRTLVVGAGRRVEPGSPDVRPDRLQGRLDVRRLRPICRTWSASSPISTTISRNRALRSLHAELRRREQLLRTVGAADLAAYRARPRATCCLGWWWSSTNLLHSCSEQPDFLHALVGIAQRGRSLGVHLILATQRPSGVISDDIRANTNLRLALRLHDTS